MSMVLVGYCFRYQRAEARLGKKRRQRRAHPEKCALCFAVKAGNPGVLNRDADPVHPDLSSQLELMHQTLEDGGI